VTARCLWCGDSDVSPSSQPLRLLSVLRYETWRCHHCRRRFPLRPGERGTTPELTVAVRRRRRRPAGRELHAVDDTLARLLRPGPARKTPDAS
jgi:hypothetical protein